MGVQSVIGEAHRRWSAPGHVGCGRACPGKTGADSEEYMAVLAHNVLKLVRNLGHGVGLPARRYKPPPRPGIQRTLWPMSRGTHPRRHGIFQDRLN